MTDKVVIFDLDGTLVDSSEGILKALKDSFFNCRIQPRHEINTNIIGPPLMDTLRFLYGEANEKKLEMLYHEFIKCYDNEAYLLTTPFDGINELLCNLKLHGVRLYIATNKRNIPSRKIISYLEWNSFFDEIFSIDDISNQVLSKSEMLHKIVVNETTLADMILYIGDRPEDAKAAADNKLKYIMVDWGFSDLSNFNGNIAITSQDLYDQIASNFPV
jgi:phosphoglycolate phosphatase